MKDGEYWVQMKDALLSLTAQAIGEPSKEVFLENFIWDDIYQNADKHCVSALVCEAIEHTMTNVPRQTKVKFAAKKMMTTAEYLHHSMVLTEVLRLFADNGIPTMLLKGHTLSRLYPTPALRQYSDIDYYQFGRYKDADQLMAQRYGVQVSDESHHHTKYNYDGIIFENHYDFLCRYDHRDNAQFDDILKDLVKKHSRTGDIQGGQYIEPPATFNALFLMQHSAAHFTASCCNLRQLIDYTLFCKHYAEEVDWQKVRETCDKVGLTPFVMTLEYICERHYGHLSHIGSSKRYYEKVLREIISPAYESGMPDYYNKWQTMSYKIRRYRYSRWKHKLCYAAPWYIDVFYGIWAKIKKPHTILH